MSQKTGNRESSCLKIFVRESLFQRLFANKEFSENMDTKTGLTVRRLNGMNRVY